MIVRRDAEEVRDWFVAFHSWTPTWWVRLIPGRFKHVCVFGYSVQARTWIFLDTSIAAMRVVLLPDGAAAQDMLAHWSANACVLKMRSRDGLKARLRFGLWCVPAVKLLLGLRGGALLPDGLWRDCLKAGATVVFADGISETQGVGSPGRSRDSGAAGVGVRQAGDRDTGQPVG